MAQRLSEAEKAEIWDRLERGEPIRVVARGMGRAWSSIREYVMGCGGRRPRPGGRSARNLSLGEREEISRGLAAGDSLRGIAARLGRAPSTISREVGANRGRSSYRALDAERTATRRARRPKRAKLASSRRLRAMVEALLEAWWSPRQISEWLARAYPDDPEMRVAHETIYQSLFVQGRGALRRELTACLRTGRAMRRPNRQADGWGRGKIRDMVMISERPAEVEDRAVPGHWEGDLLMGKGLTAIGTLVERKSRYVMLFALPNGHTAESVRTAMADKITDLPVQLRRSLTWDQGHEMAEHAKFTVDTGVQVYFCDPKSPWQRGSNENTNGLLRQYLPKGTDMKQITQKELDAMARSLNERPRQTLLWLTPSQAFAEAVAATV